MPTLADLKPDPRNARRHNPRNIGMIEKALNEVGAARSIVIDEDNVILAGNGVVEAAAQAGIERVRVVEADGNEIIAVKRSNLTPEQKQKLAIYDNRTAELAEWDTDVLGELAAEIDLGEMFSDVELAKLGVELGEPTADPGAQIDRAAELQEKWQVKRGDVWAIGKHRLTCGDSTDATVRKRVLSGDDVALVLTDPPYGISVVKGLASTIGGGKPVTIGAVRGRRTDTVGGVKNMRGPDGAAHMVDATLYRPVAGDDKPFDPRWLLDVAKQQIIFGGNYFASKLPDSRCWIVWDKDNTGNFADAELAWTSFDRGVRLFKFTWNGLVREGDRKIEGVKRMHPTQKPAGLFADILREFSDDNAVVLDPYMGSGTALVACEMTGRQGRGIEIDPAYCAVTLERMVGMGLTPQLLTDNSTESSDNGTDSEVHL